MKANPRVRRREVKESLTKTTWDSQKGRKTPQYDINLMKRDLSDINVMVGMMGRLIDKIDGLTYIQWSPSDYKKFQDMKKMFWKAQIALIKAWERYDAEAAREYRKTMGKRKGR
jgi:hypothetical protein